MSKNTYVVCSDGTVISTVVWRGSSERILKPHPNSHGYLRVRMVLNGVRQSRFVHKLVAEAFLPPRPSSKHEICHIDGNRLNNHASNLRWGTRKDNAADRKRHGREMAAINGRLSAYKLRKEVCLRGHQRTNDNLNKNGACLACAKAYRKRRTDYDRAKRLASKS